MRCAGRKLRYAREDKYIQIFHWKPRRNKAARKSQPRVGREYKRLSKENKIEVGELDLSGSEQGPVTRSSEHVNLSTGSIKRAKFIY